MALQNPWAAGQDALLGFLADREQKKMLEEDRARRDRLDQESSADRQRMREIQESQLRDLAEDRSERRAETKRLNDEKIAAGEAKREQDGRVTGLVTEMLDPNTPQERKQAIGIELDRLQVSPTILQSILNPKPETKPIVRINPRTGKVETVGEAPVNAHFVNEPAPPKDTTTKSTDNPRLPAGVQSWVQSLPSSGHAQNYQDAFKIVQSTVPKLMREHPGLDTRALVATLKSAYQVDASNPDGIVPETTPQAAPATAGAPPPAAAPQGAESTEQALFNDAHAIVSSHLNRDATPQEVQKFLSDPQNVAQLTGGR